MIDGDDSYANMVVRDQCLMSMCAKRKEIENTTLYISLVTTPPLLPQQNISFLPFLLVLVMCLDGIHSYTSWYICMMSCLCEDCTANGCC